MPGLVGNPPAIFTPGIGPNGPGPIDARRSITSVGADSSVPYGPTAGYATPNGVNGFIGPAAGSLRAPTNWFVRAAGSNLNGGSSATTTADRAGTDGATTSGSLTFTSASAAFTPADVGKGICIQNATRCYAKIAAYVNATTVTLSNPPSATASALSWSIGGAWATPEPLLNCSAYANTTCGVQSGDNVYIGAGTYRVVYTIGTNYGSAWNPTGGTVKFANAYFNGVANVVGDVTGQFTGDAGIVQFTVYTTNDKTAPSGASLLTFSGKSNLAFSNIFMKGGATVVLAAIATSQNISFVDSSFDTQLLQSANFLTATFAKDLQAAWSFDRCRFLGRTILSITAVRPTGGDLDLNFVVRNSIFIGAGAYLLAVTAGGAGFWGGVSSFDCTYLVCQNNWFTTAANMSVNTPCRAYNNFISGLANTCFDAATLGQLVEDYNIVQGFSVIRTNTAVGPHSISDASYSSLIHFGQELAAGLLLRPLAEPMAASPLLSFGNDGEQTPYDLYDRPRPAGGGSGNPYPAAGALERSSTAAQGTSPAPPSGTHSWQNTGPWYQDFLLPVSNAATTVSISVQRDANYSPPPGAGNPALLILANPTLDISAQTIADTGSSGGWNTLTSAAFTPSGTGWVTVRIASYDGSGSSVVSFADVVLT